MTAPRAPVAAALAALLAAACDRPAAAPPPREAALVVFAAASLRDAFAPLGEAFERARPGVEVTFQFAGTQTLRAQVEHGAACDVLAAADPQHLEALVQAGHAAAPVVFACNEPVLVVAPEAAATLRGLADLPRARALVLGAPEAPIGRYTAQVLDRAAAALGADFRARVEARVASRELDVRQVLAKVRLGEADAGVVYRTDALAAPELTVVPLPPEVLVVAEYPVAVMTGAAHPALARAWVDLLLSDAGQAALRRAGFAPPAARGR